MAENKRKNVLMTTMSIWNNNPMVNYYYMLKDKKRLFCDGISAQEPGTKYILANYPIDEIVVIGTKETINDGSGKKDKIEYANILDVVTEKEPDGSSRDVSAYEFYKHRIGTYLKEQGRIGEGYDAGAESVVGQKIPRKRKEELQEIYRKACKEDSCINPFLVITEKEGVNVWKSVENAIEKSIQEEFVNTEAYEKYVEKQNELGKYKDIYERNFNAIEEIKRTREDIQNNHDLSPFEKEYLYSYLQKSIIEPKLTNEIIDLKVNISELELEKIKLQYELKVLREKRQQTESNYVKYFAFCQLPDENRLYPLPENLDLENHPIALCFVKEQIGDKEVDNINGIIKALYGKDAHDKEINLYIDMQGGNRTSSYVRNAIVSVLSNQEPATVHIKAVVGTNFSAKHKQGSDIVDETRRYRILDLVSGMNAFIRYGKADMIQGYCESMDIPDDSQVKKLVDAMAAVDDAISLCNIQGLEKAIGDLRTILTKEETQTSDDFVENVFQILRDGIRNDYGSLLEPPKGEGKVDYVKLIAWCTRKGFIQQALTLIEDKMPKIYFDSGILSYKFEEDDDGRKLQDFMNSNGPKYERRVENKIFNYLPDCAVDGPAFELLWHMQSPKDILSKMLEKGKAREAYRKAMNEYKEGKGDSTIRAYIRKDIENRGNCQNADFQISKKQLDELKELLKIVVCNERFIEAYCQFRRMENDFNSGKGRNVLVSGTIYDMGRDKITRHDKEVYYSIVGNLGTMEYSVRNKKNPYLVNVTLRTDERLENHKKTLHEIFSLHEALKLERNCSNHASEKGVRLSSKTVKRAIEIYLQNIIKVLSIVSEK